MNIYKFLKTYVGSAFTGLASFCSILSVVLLFINNKTASFIALGFFCLSLAILVYGIIFAINKIVNNNSDKDYRSISSTFIYHSPDGRKSSLDVYRMIQCKRIFLGGVHFNFKWTGSVRPILTSAIQRIAPTDIHYSDDPRKWDEAVVKFSHPLKYNECTILNIRTENDDYDGKAKPWLSCKIEYPIEMMTFHVLLSYKDKDFKSPATFERKKIDSEVDGDFEYLESIDFDVIHKQYSFSKFNLEAGYIPFEVDKMNCSKSLP